MARWHRSLMDVANQAKKKGLVCYGAGFWGEVAYGLFQLFGIAPVCFCDDDISKIGGTHCGILVRSLEDAAKKYPDAVYIVCVDEGKRYDDYERKTRTAMLGKLKEYGLYSDCSEMFVSFYVFLLDIGLGTIEEDAGAIRTDEFYWEELRKIVVFNNMSNSGAWYLEQLLDGHPRMLFLPYVESLEAVYVNRLQYLEGEELLIEMTAQMMGYLHSRYEDLDCVGQLKFHSFCTDQNGNPVKDIYVDPKSYVRHLKKQLATKRKLLSYGHMIKVYFAAYNNCLGKEKCLGADYWIFYHSHLFAGDLGNNVFGEGEFDRVEDLMVIREPVQHCHSWMKRIIGTERNVPALRKDVLRDILRGEMGCRLEKKKGIENVRVVRFEDLKYRPEETLMGLCQWLQIEFVDQLLTTTVNGREIYFPANTPDGVRYITGIDTTAVGQTSFREMMTLWDEARLNVMFSSFKKAYGYECGVPDISEFSEEGLEQILAADFKFADIIQGLLDGRMDADEQYSVNEFVREVFWEYIKGYSAEVEYYDCIQPIAMGELT